MNSDDLYFSLAPTPWRGAVKVGANAYAWDEDSAREPIPDHSHKFPGLAAAVSAQVGLTEDKLAAVKKLVGEQAALMLDLDTAVSQMIANLYAPGSDYTKAQEEIADLKRQRDALIREARRQKRRADAAQSQLPPVDEGSRFLRRTPGDAIRYFASEIMKHADNNPFLAGSAMGLRMVAYDVDRLPQDDNR